MKCSLGGSHFLEEISPFYYFPLFLCIDCWGRLSYLSLLFFGALHLNGCIFPFLLCLLLLFYSQLFVRPLQITIWPFCMSFSWGWSWSLPPVTNLSQTVSSSGVRKTMTVVTKEELREGAGLGVKFDSGHVELEGKARLWGWCSSVHRGELAPSARRSHSHGGPYRPSYWWEGWSSARFMVIWRVPEVLNFIPLDNPLGLPWWLRR